MNTERTGSNITGATQSSPTGSERQRFHSHLAELEAECGPLVRDDIVAERMGLSTDDLQQMVVGGELVRVSTGLDLYFPRDYFVSGESGTWQVLPGLQGAIREETEVGKSMLQVARNLARPREELGGISVIAALRRSYQSPQPVQ